jgi:hypothetical protein
MKIRHNFIPITKGLTKQKENKKGNENKKINLI